MNKTPYHQRTETKQQDGVIRDSELLSALFIGKIFNLLQSQLVCRGLCIFIEKQSPDSQTKLARLKVYYFLVLSV